MQQQQLLMQQQLQQRARYFSPNEHMPNLVPQNRMLIQNQTQTDEELYPFSPRIVQFSGELNQPKQYQQNQQTNLPNKPSIKNDNTPKILRLKDLPPAPYDPV